MTESASNAAFAPPGHVLFWRNNALLAQPIDTMRWLPRGDPVVLADRPGFDDEEYFASFAVAPTGALAYGQWTRQDTQLVWFDRAGTQMGTLGAAGTYYNLALSPDGQRVAVSMMRDGNRDVWLLDTGREAASRFTFEPGRDMTPLWSPDGVRLVYTSDDYQLYVKSATGASRAEPLLAATAGRARYAISWSTDGRFILYDEENMIDGLHSDIWLLPMTGDGKPTPFVQTPAMEGQGHFSPDARWVVYVSDESGRPEIYVQPFPQTGGKYQVSFEGGAQPAWRPDGKEIFYVGLNDKLMAARVDTSKGFAAERPVPLFDTGIVFGTGFGNRHPFIVRGDGQRFLVNRARTPIATPITIVLNWAAGTNKLPN